MGKITLKNPVLINGKQVTELNYDTNEITGVLFAEAEARKSSGKTMSIVPASEFDTSLHIYLGYAAVIAADPSVDWSDLERVKGSDIVQFMRIGRNFMLGVSEKDSPAENSEEPTETSAEYITPAYQISDESDSQILS